GTGPRGQPDRGVPPGATAPRPGNHGRCRSDPRDAVDGAGRCRAVRAGRQGRLSVIGADERPARPAGVGRIAMCVPTPDGVMNPLVLAAARRAGVTEIYRVGGAQAVAALA